VSRTPRGGGGVVIGSPSSAPTRLLRPKKEPRIGASSARVKKEPGTPASFTRVKKEPVSFTRVKKEHDAPAPPSSKNACRLADKAARQLDYQAPGTKSTLRSLKKKSKPAQSSKKFNFAETKWKCLSFSFFQETTRVSVC
jgi:hypothetical protein